MSKINKPTAPLVTIDPDTKADLVNGEVPASQLPSYVDDVLEFANVEAFPATGEEGKIYVALNTNLTYRWSGSAYIQINDVDLSNYYTKSESDTLLGGKEDTISDLEDIRSGAAAGATAVQSSDLDNEISAYVGSHLPGSGLSAGSDSSGYNQLSVDENYLNEYLEFAKPADLEAKQDVISDLDAIRAGAAAGATALQSVPSEYVTETELSNYHDSSKQDAINDLETIRSGAAAGATAKTATDNLTNDGDRTSYYIKHYDFDDFTSEDRATIMQVYQDFAAGKHPRLYVISNYIAYEQHAVSNECILDYYGSNGLNIVIPWLGIASGVTVSTRSYYVVLVRNGTISKGSPYWFRSLNIYVDSTVSQYQWDEAPVQDSKKALTSGAVYTALQAKADASNTYTKSEVDTAIANAIGNTLNEEF